MAGPPPAPNEAPARPHLDLDARFHLAAIVDSSDDAIVSKDLSGIIQTWNPGAERIFNYTADQIVGKSVTILIPPDRRHEEDEILARIQRGERVDHFETKRVRGDGRVIDVSITISPVRDAEGRIVGASKIARDVTAQKLAQRELQGMYDRLRELDEMKTQFINTASHELRTPLTPIVLQLSILQGQNIGSLTERQRKALTVVDRNTKRLTLLVEDMLDVARLQNGRLSIQREPIDVGVVVEEAVEAFQEPATQGGIALQWSLEGDLRVSADPHRVSQVMYSLLSNAVKFTPAGGAIRIRAHRAPAEIAVAIADTGIGLTEEQRAALFRPFSQVHGPTQSRAGTGLGLYICKGTIEEHGGRIWVESGGPGRGSTFAFALPTGQP